MVAATSFCLLVFLWVWGASWKILTNVACVEAGLGFSYFQVGSHMVVAVSDPLSDAAYRACHNLFGVDVFYEHLELWIASCLVKKFGSLLPGVGCGLPAPDFLGAGVHSLSSKS